MKLLYLQEYNKSINKKNGMPATKQEQLRNRIINFMNYYSIIMNKGNRKILSKAIIIFYFHIKQVPYKDFDYYQVAATAVFLASKLEDQPKKLRRFCHAYNYLMENKKNIKFDTPLFSKDGNDGDIENIWTKIKHSKPKKSVIDKITRQFCINEVKLLISIRFDLDIQLPWKWKLLFEQKYKREKQLNDNDFFKTAENFINDSFRTDASLYYPASIIALSCIKLASIYTTQKIPDYNNKPWYLALDPNVNINEINEVCQLITVLYKHFLKKNDTIQITQ